MDQNNPRDDAGGAQPPAEPGSADTSAWNQAPTPDQSPPAAGSGQEAAAEYAAWSADAAYQQQAAQQPNPSDTQAFAAPEPQSATYSDPQQPYQQPPQQYQQPQQPYQQPPQQYQQPQQPYQQPQAYDQSAPGQQPQYYDPNAYGQQPQYYDPNAYGQQPQYYDPNAYGQQPGYYDQNAYQQQYAQQGYPPQPGQPYAYAQPGQEQWAQAEPGGYNRSFLAVLGAWVLLTWGVVFGIIGALVLWFQSVTELIPADVTLSEDVMDLATRADDQVFAAGGTLLIVGLVQLIGAVGIFGHRRWGRAFGIVLGLLGVLAGIGALIVSFGFEALDVGLGTALEGEEGSVAMSVVVLGSYLIVFLGMFIGRRHFKRKGVDG